MNKLHNEESREALTELKVVIKLPSRWSSQHQPTTYIVPMGGSESLPG